MSSIAENVKQKITCSIFFMWNARDPAAAQVYKVGVGDFDKILEFLLVSRLNIRVCYRKFFASPGKKQFLLHF